MSGIYKILSELRSWPTLFWSLAFPILLSTIFKFMFGGIADATTFSESQVGVIVSAEKSELEKEFLTVTKEVKLGDASMFVVQEYTDMADATAALKAGKISGIIDVNQDFAITFKGNGVAESLIKVYVEQYLQNMKLVEDAIKLHPENIEKIIGAVSGNISKSVTVKAIELKGADKNPFSQYMYSVIGMTCLIASNMGCYITIMIQADASALGARRSVSPTGKAKIVFTDFLASYLLYDVLSMMVLLYMRFVLQTDFGKNMWPVVLATLIGNFCGMAAGLMIGVCARGSVRKKDGLCVAFFMGSSFFAGLQWGDIVRIIEKKAPLFNRINPATLIVNSFKSWAVFGDITNFFINIVTLLVIGLIFLLIAVLKLRRTKYASI